MTEPCAAEPERCKSALLTQTRDFCIYASFLQVSFSSRTSNIQLQPHLTIKYPTSFPPATAPTAQTCGSSAAPKEVKAESVPGLTLTRRSEGPVIDQDVHVNPKSVNVTHLHRRETVEVMVLLLRLSAFLSRPQAPPLQLQPGSSLQPLALRTARTFLEVKVHGS